MELEDNRIGDVIEDEDQQSWSFFNGVNYIIGGFNYIIWGGNDIIEMRKRFSIRRIET